MNKFSLSLCYIFCYLLSATAFGAAAINPAPPNILLLIAEDMSPRVGAFGDTLAKTPNLDALAAQGVRFDNVFTTAGVCAPSRTAQILGVHQNSVGAQHMRTMSSPVGKYAAVPPPAIKAYPELLRRNGYYSYTDEKLDYQFSGALFNTGPMTIWDDEGFRTHWRNRPASKPFFGLVNFQHTHESGLFTQLGHWPDNTFHFLLQLMRAVTLDQDVGTNTNPADVSVPPYYPDTPLARETIALHYNNIAAMDAEVGRLMAELEADGLADNTIVIWTTDHGDCLPRGKRDLFDASLNVPIIIKWPKGKHPAHLTPGMIEHKMVSFVDLAPTVLRLAGVAAPEYLQGQDFLTKQTPRRYVFAAGDRIDELKDHQRAVRDKRFKYIQSWQPQRIAGAPSAFRDVIPFNPALRKMFNDGELNEVQAQWFMATGEQQFYDTLNDPHEINNLIDSPLFDADKKRLQAALNEHLSKTEPAQYAINEPALAKAFWPNGEQPVTESPQVTNNAGSLTLTAINNASIRYRVNDGEWLLYSKALRLMPNDALEARAVRYGWAESEPLLLTMP